MMRNKPKGPKPERDPRLPEKPKGQTVGSFTGGLQALPDGMAKRLSKYIRWVPQLDLSIRNMLLLEPYQAIDMSLLMAPPTLVPHKYRPALLQHGVRVHQMCMSALRTQKGDLLAQHSC